MNFTQKISVEIGRAEPIKRIDMKQHDTGRVLEIALTKNGEYFPLDPLTEGVDHVLVKLCRPDLEPIVLGAEVKDGNIIVRIKSQALAAVGRVTAECAIYNGEDEQVISSFYFYIHVTKAAVDSSELIGEDEYDVIQELFGDLAKAEEERAESEKERKRGEEIREQNEQERQKNEDARKKGEEERGEEEKKRIEGEKKREENEKLRDDNENVRNSSERTRNEEEGKRALNETERVEEELKRAQSEGRRNLSEDARNLSENTRNESESIRRQNEEIRNANESTRGANETERIKSEAERKSEERAREADEEVRQGNEVNRQKGEAARNGAENDRNANEIIRQGNERERIAEEEKRKNSMPNIGEDGDWYLGKVSTGVHAQGDRGADGVGITDAKIDEEGKLIITCSDGNTINAGIAKGRDGQDGAPGAPGKNGSDGAAGEPGRDGENGTTFTPHVSPEGVLTWTNDGDLPNPDPVTIKGEDGQDGAPGKDGSPGAPGKDGTPGENGKDGRGIASAEINDKKELIIHYTDETQNNLGVVVGKDGKDGTTFTPFVSEDGDLSWSNDGEKQNPPTVNIKGKDGKDGKDGAPGRDGTNGTDGAPGAPGANGKDGAAGKDGSTWYSGAAVPDGSTGKEGDFYLDTTTGDVYNKTEGGWGDPICNLMSKKPTSKIYGVSGMGNINPVWKRTYDASGVTLSLVQQDGNENLIDFVLSDNGMQEFFNFQETTDENGNVFVIIPPMSFRYDRINDSEVQALSVKLYEDGDEKLGYELHPAFKKWTSGEEFDGYGSIQIAKYLSAPYDTVNESEAEDNLSGRDPSEIKVRSVAGVNYALSYVNWDDGMAMIKATDPTYRMFHWMYRDLLVKLACIFFARADIYNMLDLEDGQTQDCTTGTTDEITTHSGMNKTSGQIKLFGLDAAFAGTNVNGIYWDSNSDVCYTHLLDTDAKNDEGYTKSSLSVPMSYTDNIAGSITKISVDADEKALGIPTANIQLSYEEDAGSPENHSQFYCSRYRNWSVPQERGQMWAFQKYVDDGGLFTSDGLFFVSWYREFRNAWYISGSDGGALRLCKEASEGVGKGTSPYENKA